MGLEHGNVDIKCALGIVHLAVGSYLRRNNHMVNLWQ